MQTICIRVVISSSISILHPNHNLFAFWQKKNFAGTARHCSAVQMCSARLMSAVQNSLARHMSAVQIHFAQQMYAVQNSVVDS